MSWFKNMFSRHQKTNEELEDELTEQILQENEESLKEAYDESLQASIIIYELDDDSEYSSTHTTILVENYTCKMLPEEGSIIWIPVNNFMRPFKFIRVDFIQSDNLYESMRVYLVVKPALTSDIV